MTNKKINLLKFNTNELISYCLKIKEKSFRAKQLQKWIYNSKVKNFSEMTNLNKSLKKKLIKYASIQTPKIISHYKSIDGTQKWIINIKNNHNIETVFIPKKKKGTLCISSQIGCIIKCPFCFTGKNKFKYNLNINEIISQVNIVNKYLKYSTKNKKLNENKITNIVFMGMGEPLLNYNSVISSIRILMDKNIYGISKRKITLSTSGIVPMINKLRKDIPISLAISLHASNNSLRNKLVPINKKYPLNKLIKACKKYTMFSPKKLITFEYCMINKINDSNKHAYELINLVKNISCKFNLIPCNYFPNTIFKSSKEKNIETFYKILNNSGYITTIRKPRGSDIYASCGQLNNYENNNII